MAIYSWSIIISGHLSHPSDWSEVVPLFPPGVRGGVGVAHSRGYIARCALGVEHAPLVFACGFLAVRAVLSVLGHLLLRILTRPLHVHCAYLRIYTSHTAPSICYSGFTVHFISINRFGSKTSLLRCDYTCNTYTRSKADRHSIHCEVIRKRTPAVFWCQP